MRGLLTALEHARTDQILISPVDMPFICVDVFTYLVNSLEQNLNAVGVMLQRTRDTNLEIEPLPAAFRKSAGDVISQCLAANNNSLYRLTESQHVIVERAPDHWPEETWLNLNTPEDLSGLSRIRI
jgi:molybdopterin-guanine dinucleotide biosynthesis protein A